MDNKKKVVKAVPSRFIPDSIKKKKKESKRGPEPRPNPFTVAHNLKKRAVKKSATSVLGEIAKLERASNFMIPRAGFCRMVK